MPLCLYVSMWCVHILRKKRDLLSTPSSSSTICFRDLVNCVMQYRMIK
jgi:hypothetical protein